MKTLFFFLLAISFGAQAQNFTDDDRYYYGLFNKPLNTSTGIVFDVPRGKNVSANACEEGIASKINLKLKPDWISCEPCFYYPWQQGDYTKQSTAGKNICPSEIFFQESHFDMYLKQTYALDTDPLLITSQNIAGSKNKNPLGSGFFHYAVKENAQIKKSLVCNLTTGYLKHRGIINPKIINKKDPNPDYGASTDFQCLYLDTFVCSQIMTSLQDTNLSDEDKKTKIQTELQTFFSRERYDLFRSFERRETEQREIHLSFLKYRISLLSALLGDPLLNPESSTEDILKQAELWFANTEKIKYFEDFFAQDKKVMTKIVRIKVDPETHEKVLAVFDKIIEEPVKKIKLKAMTPLSKMQDEIKLLEKFTTITDLFQTVQSSFIQNLGESNPGLLIKLIPPNPENNPIRIERGLPLDISAIQNMCAHMMGET